MPHDGRSILVIDDDDDVREALATFLQMKGFDVQEAANGREGLMHLSDPDKICLILLDLFMPEMNGWAFREEQTRDGRIAGIPVVVMSADTHAAKAAVSPGVIAAFGKPIEFDALLKVVHQHC
jgi:DNA-binding NtrC family response regulator